MTLTTVSYWTVRSALMTTAVLVPSPTRRLTLAATEAKVALSVLPLLTSSSRSSFWITT